MMSARQCPTASRDGVARGAGHGRTRPSRTAMSARTPSHEPHGALAGVTRIVPCSTRSSAEFCSLWVYTPPSYDGVSALPVVYVLHDAQSPSMDWTLIENAADALNQLFTDPDMTPTVVAIPITAEGGRPAACVPAPPEHHSPVGPPGSTSKRANELFADVIPFMERTYMISAQGTVVAVSTTGLSASAAELPRVVGSTTIPQDRGLSADDVGFFSEVAFRNRLMPRHRQVNTVYVFVPPLPELSCEPSSASGATHRCGRAHYLQQAAAFLFGRGNRPEGDACGLVKSSRRRRATRRRAHSHD